MSTLTIAFLVLALAVGAGVVYQRVEATRDRTRFPPPGELIEVGGHRLHLRRSGDGPPPSVIFDAGIAASSLSWTHVQPRVARLAATYWYDRAGLGWSDRAATPRAMATLVDELSTLLQKAHVPPPFLIVGHSFGGLVGRAFAARFPESMAGLVLVDALPPTEWSNALREELRDLRRGVFLSRVGAVLAGVGFVRFCLARLAGGAPGFPRRVSSALPAPATRLLARMVGEVQKLPTEVLPAVRAQWSLARSFCGMADHLVMLPENSRSVAAGPPTPDIPIVVLTARSHSAQRIVEDHEMAACYTRGRHAVVEHAGHWIHLDCPDEVVAAIEEVLQVCRAREGSG